MRVRMTVHISGDRNGTPWPPAGQVMDLPDREAQEYVAAGMAVPVADFARAETAMPPVAAVETRVEVATESAAENRPPRRPGLTKAKGPAAP